MQNLDPDTSARLDYFRRLAADYLSIDYTPADIDAIVRLALDSDCGLWHAAWLYRDTGRPCPCTPCVRARTSA